MSTSSCEQLDDYLMDWLSEAQRSEFEAHLDNCHQCRSEVEQQRQMYRLLAIGVERLEPPPSLLASIETHIRSFRRRRTVQFALGASTCIAFALLGTVWLASQMPKPVTNKISGPVAVTEHSGPPTVPAPQADRPVRITLSDPSTAVLVPVKTDAPNVSIVWVYPALTPPAVGSRNDVN